VGGTATANASILDIPTDSHSLDDFDPSLPRLPTHLQIYTWQSCTLRELCGLFLSAMPDLLPQPYAGTRIAFRLVYPNMQGSNRTGGPGRYTCRDIGSVVVGARTANETSEARGGDSTAVADALKQLDGDPEKTLSDVKFLIGDFIACAILPPLPDGSAPAPPPPTHDSSRGPPGPYGGRGRENGFGGRGDFGYGRGARGGGRYDDRRSFDDRRLSGGVPSGEWRRGEAPPEREPGHGRGRGGSGGGGPESSWHARGRGRW
jgi:histone deacetylase complex subunit SAP18